MLEAQARWARAVTRRRSEVTVRVLGDAAFVYSVGAIEARARPDLLSGTEIESIVLSRLGRTWFIELIHASTGNRADPAEGGSR